MSVVDIHLHNTIFATYDEWWVIRVFYFGFAKERLDVEPDNVKII